MAECDPRSFFDTQMSISSDLTKIAYFDSISRDQFDDLKKSGRLGALRPIEGVPVSFDLSYDQAETLIDQIRRIKNITYENEHHDTILTSMLSDTGLQAYKACIAAKGGVGTFLWISKDATTATRFFIGVRWEGGVGGPDGKFDFVDNSPFQIIGGAVVGPYAKQPPRLIKSGQEITIEIQRDLTEKFEFSTSINGYTPADRIFLPPYQPRTVQFGVVQSPKVTSSSSFGGGGNEGANVDQYPEFDAGANQEFLPPSAMVVGHTDGEHSEIRIVTAEPKRIIWRVWAKTPTKDHGAFAQAYVSVIAASW